MSIKYGHYNESKINCWRKKKKLEVKSCVNERRLSRVWGFSWLYKGMKWSQQMTQREGDHDLFLLWLPSLFSLYLCCYLCHYYLLSSSWTRICFSVYTSLCLLKNLRCVVKESESLEWWVEAEGTATTVKNRSQVTRHKKNGQVIKTWFNRNAFEKRENGLLIGITREKRRRKINYSWTWPRREEGWVRNRERLMSRQWKEDKDKDNCHPFLSSLLSLDSRAKRRRERVTEKKKKIPKKSIEQKALKLWLVTVDAE